MPQHISLSFLPKMFPRNRYSMFIWWFGGNLIQFKFNQVAFLTGCEFIKDPGHMPCLIFSPTPPVGNEQSLKRFFIQDLILVFIFFKWGYVQNQIGNRTIQLTVNDQLVQNTITSPKPLSQVIERMNEWQHYLVDNSWTTKTNQSNWYTTQQIIK